MKIKRGDTDIDRNQGQQVKQRRAEFDFQRGLVTFSEHFLSKKQKRLKKIVQIDVSFNLKLG